MNVFILRSTIIFLILIKHKFIPREGGDMFDLFPYSPTYNKHQIDYLRKPQIEFNYLHELDAKK